MPSIETATKTDAGLAAELRLSVVRLRRRLIGERDPENDLSLGAMAVLGCLYRRGPLQIGELASLERVRPPSMTRTVTGLEADGYVERRPHESDARLVVVHLTDKGEATLLVDRKRRDAWLACQLRELSSDERAVLRAAAPILEKLAAS
ncbi:MAG TPA: MarR family transcriptional regulator [Marmoricola sp.]|nr:MarR family transcriptional regulator [Marmoricola sp.]